MYYLIRNNLTECNPAELTKTDTQFVAVLRADEWEAKKDLFDMGIDMDLNPADIHSTKIEVNYDSLTGTFSLPNRSDLMADNVNFAFALDEKGIVLLCYKYNCRDKEIPAMENAVS